LDFCDSPDLGLDFDDVGNDLYDFDDYLADCINFGQDLYFVIPARILLTWAAF
jgi:hypothetical protein